jgi:S1-C subfamily serine protease
VDDDGFEEEEPVGRWLHPDDRLWRHPSEVSSNPPPLPFAGTLPSRLGDGRLWTVSILAGLIGAMLATGVIAAGGGFNRGATTVVRPIERVTNPLPQRVSDLTNPSETGVEIVAERLRPAIVQVKADAGKTRSGGSGVVFRSDGHILTNQHVVDGASRITVILPDGTQRDAKLVGADPETDIAVIKIDGQNYPVATLGTAAGLKVGQLGVAIGSPLGLAGGPSVSVGVISATGREVDTPDGRTPLLDMIQTDAPIAPGSSGGALVNGSGAVIGITTAVAVADGGAAGLGFAIPIDIARDVAEQVITTGKVKHVWLGVEGEDLDSTTADQLGLHGGAVVRQVRSQSPADKAGVVNGDIVVSVDGRPIATMGALVVALRSHLPGDTIYVNLLHEGKPRSVRLSLAERPKDVGP